MRSGAGSLGTGTWCRYPVPGPAQRLCRSRDRQDRLGERHERRMIMRTPMLWLSLCFAIATLSWLS